MKQFDVVLIPDGDDAQKARRCEAPESRFAAEIAAEIVAEISYYQEPFDAADAEVTNCETGERTFHHIIVRSVPTFDAERYQPEQELGGE